MLLMFEIAADGVSGKPIFAEIAFLLYYRIIWGFLCRPDLGLSRAPCSGWSVMFSFLARGVPLRLDKKYFSITDMLND